MPKVNDAFVYEKVVVSFMFNQTSSFMHPIYLVHCRRHPGQYEYFKDYDDLEASCFLFSYIFI